MKPGAAESIAEGAAIVPRTRITFEVPAFREDVPYRGPFGGRHLFHLELVTSISNAIQDALVAGEIDRSTALECLFVVRISCDTGLAVVPMAGKGAG